MDLELGDTRLLIDTARAKGLLRNQLAYVLATAKWETAHTVKPVRETLAATDDIAIQRLDRAWTRGKLPWVRSAYWARDADGKSWLGRGFVQLTHKTNYIRATNELGVDFITDPDTAMQPGPAAKVIVHGMLEGWFTGHKLADYITLKKSDFVQARRIVNGMDKASNIAALAKQYDSALITEGYDAARPSPDVQPVIGASIISVRAAITAILARFNAASKKPTNA